MGILVVLGDNSDSVTPGWKQVAKEFKAIEINIPISATDWVSLPPFDAAKIDFDNYIEEYDIHSYDWVGDKGVVIIKDWVQWVHTHNKPFFY